MRASAFITICGLLFPALAAAQSPPPAATKPAPLPIPDAAAQSRARAMIHKIFKDDFAKTAATDRQSLARRLFAEAAATKDDAAARYILYADAADLAAGAGDADTALQSLAELAGLYTVDLLELKRAALLRASAAAMSPESAETLTRLCLETADAAALADNFDAVRQLANLAEASANKSFRVAFVVGIQIHLADLHALAAEFPQVQKALDLLTKTPDDAPAHLLVGKFYALHKGQWDVGLPHLAAGNDPTLRALAAKELAAPADGLEQTALGDAWWDFAQKSAGPARTQSDRHARLWYDRAQKSLTGVTLARIQSRLQTPAPEIAPASVGPKIIPPSAGNTVNLLALVDTSKDVADGKWFLDAGALTVDNNKYATLQLPYSPPDEYDLRVAFTRTQGEGPIELLLAARKKAFSFAVDVKGEARFERVNNKIAKDNPTDSPIAITNNHEYTVTVQVRKDAVRALLDDKLITEWKTDYKDLSRYPVWKLPDEKLCGLGANNAKVTFHRVELIEVTGTGKPLRSP